MSNLRVEEDYYWPSSEPTAAPIYNYQLSNEVIIGIVPFFALNIAGLCYCIHSGVISDSLP